MKNSLRRFFLFFVCSLIVPVFRAQEKHKQDVPPQEISESGKSYENQTFSNAQSYFSNLTEYLLLLDDIYNQFSSSQNISKECKFETSMLLEKANAGDRNALKSKL